MDGKSETEYLTHVCREFMAVTLDPTVTKETALRVITDGQERVAQFVEAARKYYGWTWQLFGAGKETAEVGRYKNSAERLANQLGDLWGSAIFGRRVFCDAFDKLELSFQQTY